MGNSTNRRDYKLSGSENKKAIQKGLVTAEWYASPIPREKMKELMKRKDGPAIRDTLIWLISLGALGSLIYFTWFSIWSIPLLLIYGIFWVTPGDSRWHECGHGTAFKTQWLNDTIYYLASFMIYRPATAWKWSHSRHHTDTIIVGRDPEIVAPRPPIWQILMMEIFRLYAAPKELKKTIFHFFGKLDPEETDYIPKSEHHKVYLEARIVILILLSIITYSLFVQSILPIILFILPAFYGNIFVLLFGMSQHLGLNEDVLDHRLNSRTIYMNPLLRFLYWNMNYHLEHHMFPMVPYHALPKLHELMKADCPEPYPSLLSAFKEIIPTLIKQSKDPSYTIQKPLPSTAQPYYYGPAYASKNA